MRKKQLSVWKQLFMVSLGLLGVAIVATVYFRVQTSLAESSLEEQNTEVRNIQKQIDEIESEPGYNKIALVRDLIEGAETLPWSQHIPKVISILQDIQGIDGSSIDKITLSDFRVSLDEIELQGTVSRLILLYYTSEERGFTGLIDRFKQLDFIEDIRIQTYEKEEGKGYEFTLNAKVVLENSG